MRSALRYSQIDRSQGSLRGGDRNRAEVPVWRQASLRSSTACVSVKTRPAPAWTARLASLAYSGGSGGRSSSRTPLFPDGSATEIAPRFPSGDTPRFARLRRAFRSRQRDKTTPRSGFLSTNNSRLGTSPRIV
jgi:hypothetical protein